MTIVTDGTVVTDVTVATGGTVVTNVTVVTVGTVVTDAVDTIAIINIIIMCIIAYIVVEDEYYNIKKTFNDIH